MKMERWSGWICIKQTFLWSTKCMLQKLSSRLRHKSRGNNEGLMNLYKDMESCGEYSDIQVMWEMIHSSSGYAFDGRKRNKRASWKFCFRPT